MNESLVDSLPDELTDAQAEELRDVLTKHYGSRVATASEHCHALMEWVRVMAESGDRKSVV